ncbi:hypothetical protein BDR04DRAFT_1160413 [Suillus decipiens]|nr:hypothetical protein BDR04DRAFT_1160413 [Suillus decipiens]
MSNYTFNFSSFAAPTLSGPQKEFTMLREKLEALVKLILDDKEELTKDKEIWIGGWDKLTLDLEQCCKEGAEAGHALTLSEVEITATSSVMDSTQLFRDQLRAKRITTEQANLPAGWKDAPQQWLYGLFLTIDANFHLKCKAVSSDSVDSSLSHGWEYFVEDKAHKDFLHSSADSIQEKSTCSSHNAVNMADMKSNCGLTTTDLGTVDCAHHNMKLPNAVGDLQKGER